MDGFCDLEEEGAVAIWCKEREQQSRKMGERKRESAYKVSLLREIIKKLMRVNILLKYLVK